MECSSYLPNRLEVGRDGKTSSERLKGKKARVQGIEFGEAVLFKRLTVGGGLGKLSIMWEDGIFLGVKGSTAEMVIGSASGVVKTWSV